MRLIDAAGLTCALALTACSLAAAAAPADKVSETFDKTVAFPSGGTVRLHTFSGSVRVSGADRTDVMIHAVRRAEREVLDHVKLDVTASGSDVVIDANKRDAGWVHPDDNVVETTFEIEVPRGAKLQLDSFSSPVTVRDVAGETHVKTFSGQIDVAGGKAALGAETFSGAIDIDAAAAGPQPSITAKTFSGRIQTHVSSDARGQVEFDSFSGQFNTDIPLTLHSMGKKRLSADLPGGATGASLDFHTFSGDVRITK